MRVLVFGKNGQLGQSLCAQARGDVVAFDRTQADFRDPLAVAARVRDLSPDVVINAAAYTDVAKAESAAEEAHRVNAEAVGALAEAVGDCGARLVHYSTDYVFDGTQDAPYREDDLPAPLNVYGASKLAGEHRIAASGCGHLIFRTSWVVSPHGGNFVKTILRLAAARERLEVVDDQIGAPTSTALIAATTWDILSGAKAMPDGIYHLTAAGAVSRYELARHVVAGACHIVPVASDDRADGVSRPKNSRLDCGKLEAHLGAPLPDWRGDVDEIVAQCAERQTA